MPVIPGSSDALAKQILEAGLKVPANFLPARAAVEAALAATRNCLLPIRDLNGAMEFSFLKVLDGHRFYWDQSLFINS
jgi:hypothetical protein